MVHPLLRGLSPVVTGTYVRCYGDVITSAVAEISQCRHGLHTVQDQVCLKKIGYLPVIVVVVVVVVHVVVVVVVVVRSFVAGVVVLIEK